MRRTGPLACAPLAVVALLAPQRNIAAEPKERRATVFFTAEVHGAVEPCGCTSDPLGDLSRFAGVIKAAKKRTAVLLLDAGGLSYPSSSLAADKHAAAALKAEFLADELGKLAPFAAGVADEDLAAGPERVTPKRLASNLSAAFVASSRLETVGGIRIGIVGVADRALGGDDPIVAARRDIDKLRRGGAEVVFALAPVAREVASRLAKDAGADFVIAGRQVGLGRTRPQPAGNGFVLTPGEELQEVGRLELVLRAGSESLADAGSPEASQQRLEEIDRQVKQLDSDLEKWAATATGKDAAFVEMKKQERANLVAERDKLKGAGAWTPPATGSYFSSTLVALRRALPRDAGVAAAMKALDRRIGEANLRDKKPPPEPAAGEARYVGVDACGRCHASAVAFWRKTVHAQAWKTLVQGGKENDRECVRCHVTGYDRAGGATLGYTKGLEAVQCETCHGPGSIHVAQEGNEEPASVKRKVPETVCAPACHNEKHSDTFKYDAYLRDILGKGHGELARTKLGAGATGHEIRTKALAEAKRRGSAAAKKM